MKLISMTALRMLLVLAALASPLLCEDKTSIVILRTAQPLEPAQFCRGVIETQFQSVRNLKINGKSEVRAEPLPGDGAPPAVTRQEYEHAKSLNIKDLSQLELRDGVLYGLSGSGETLLLFPQDKKPEKNSPLPLAEMYKVAVEAQSSQAKSKDKQNFNLQDIWKIFNLNPSEKPEAALFLHVAQENKAAFWKGYLKNVSEYKLVEAVAGLRDTLSQCVTDSLLAFSNGAYSALKDAEASALEAKSVEDSPATQALVQRVQTEQKNVQDLLLQASALNEAHKWDDALTTLEPLRKYSGQFPEFDSAYGSANDSSYSFHLQAAKGALDRNVLADAVKEYDIALTRKPDSSEAQSGKREALIRKTIADSHQLRQQKKPEDARAAILALIAADAAVGDDTRVTAELKLASCEFGSRMLAEAQRLVLTPAKRLKPLSTEAVEKSYVDAFDKLIRANDACSTKPVADLLEQVRKQLADFHLDHARKAQSRGAFGTALLYSRTAQRYAPDSDASAMVDQMGRTLQDNLRVHVGIVFPNGTNGGGCQSDIQYFTQALAAQLSSDFILLDENKARALSQTPHSQMPPNHVLLFGQVQYCSIQRNTRDQQVPSKYRVHNPDYENLQNSEQSAEQQYKSCRSTYGEANCGNAKSTFESIKSQRKNTQEWLWNDYNYTSRLTSLRGSLSVTLQLVTPTGQKKIGPFEQQVQDQCLEEVDIRDDDMTKVGLFGSVNPILQQIVQARSKSHCPLNEDDQYKSTMQQNIEQSVRLVVPEQAGRVPREYLIHARGATNQQAAFDDYVMFLLSIVPKGQDEKDEALKFIKSRHFDLEPELLAITSPSIQPGTSSSLSAPDSGSASNSDAGPRPVIRTTPSPNTVSPSNNGAESTVPNQLGTTEQFTSVHQYDVVISYPNTWQSRDAKGYLAIAPPDGFLGNAIIYGVVIGHSRFSRAQSFDDATQDLVKRLQQANPGLRASGNSTVIRVNGIEGRSVQLSGISPLQRNGQPVPEHDWLIALPRPQGGLVYAVFAAPEEEFGKFQSTYEKMANSLQPK